MNRKHSFKPPAFQLYAKEFLQDEAVIAMHLNAVGAYIVLLCHQWTEGTIPSDLRMLARICRTSDEEMRQVWPEVQGRFVAVRNHPDRLVNLKLEIVRSERQKFSRKQAEFGRVGADKKWSDNSNGNNGVNGLPHSDPMGYPMGYPMATLWGNDGSGSESGSVNTPPTPSKKSGRGKSAKRTREEIERALGPERLAWWTEFISIFPCKDGKLPGMDAFERRVTTPDLWQRVKAGAIRYAAKAKARPDMSLKYSQGWINDERWEDGGGQPAVIEPPRVMMEDIA